MTMKLESLVNWSVFGYGMIARSQADVPESENDPVVVFTHKMAVGGKFHNGEPILSPKEEKAMLKECAALVDMLNANFTHINDYVPVGDEYNRPKNVRKNAKGSAPAPVVTETPKEPVKRARRASTAPATPPAPVPVKAKRKTKEEKAREAYDAIRKANLQKGRDALKAKREQIRKDKEAAEKRAAEEAATKARPRARVKATTAPVKVEEPPKKNRRKARETA